MLRKLVGLLAVLTPVLVAYLIHKRIEDHSQACLDDPPLQLDDGTVIYPCHVFRSTYQEARMLFRSAASHMASAELYTLPVIGDATMDIAVLAGDLPGLVVHTSGVHGVEGFAGSAIQLAHLQAASKVDEAHRRATSPTLVLVHAVNPWGMARYRRTNENNVDLNRNALTEEEWKRVAAYPNHVNYQKFDQALFNPAYAPTFWTSNLVFWVKAVWGILCHGIPTLKAAMVGGQYYNPKGIFYGGSGQHEASIQVLEKWMTDFLADRPKSEVVTWLDVHTGLGVMGEDTLLFLPKEKGSVQALQEVVQDITTFFPGLHTPFSDQSSQNAMDVVQGYEETIGFTTSYFSKLFQLQQMAILGAQEFGTVPNVMVAHALVIENAARHHMSMAEALPWAKATSKRAFYPQSIYWRRCVLNRGLRVLRQALVRSATLSQA